MGSTEQFSDLPPYRALLLGLESLTSTLESLDRDHFPAETSFSAWVDQIQQAAQNARQLLESIQKDRVTVAVAEHRVGLYRGDRLVTQDPILELTDYLTVLGFPIEIIQVEPWNLATAGSEGRFPESLLALQRGQVLAEDSG